MESCVCHTQKLVITSKHEKESKVFCESLHSYQWLALLVETAILIRA